MVVFGVNIGSLVNEQFGQITLALKGRKVQGRTVAVSFCSNIGAFGDKELGHVLIAVLHRSVQGCPDSLVFYVDINTRSSKSCVIGFIFNRLPYENTKIETVCQRNRTKATRIGRAILKRRRNIVPAAALRNINFCLILLAYQGNLGPVAGLVLPAGRLVDELKPDLLSRKV